jgi:hypothetical protein
MHCKVLTEDSLKVAAQDAIQGSSKGPNGRCFARLNARLAEPKK